MCTFKLAFFCKLFFALIAKKNGFSSVSILVCGFKALLCANCLLHWFSRCLMRSSFFFAKNSGILERSSGGSFGTRLKQDWTNIGVQGHGMKSRQIAVNSIKLLLLLQTVCCTAYNRWFFSSMNSQVSFQSTTVCKLFVALFVTHFMGGGGGGQQVCNLQHYRHEFLNPWRYIRIYKSQLPSTYL